MSSKSLPDELRSTRGLAQMLWRECRDSRSSYKLLATSLKNLRNILEELEELEIFEESLEIRPNDMRLSDQIAQTCKLLQRLDLSLQSYRGSKNKDVDEKVVSDLKTDLDVIEKELTTAYETMSTGEIPLKLDTRDIPAFASPSSQWASTSPSAAESGHERGPSSHTSSAWSMAIRESIGNQINLGSPLQDAPTQEWQASEEKEVYAAGGADPRSPNTTSSAAATTPSLDWRSPFAVPDLMSISIEEASNMILRGDDTSTPLSAMLKEIMAPQTPSSTYSDDTPPSAEPQVPTGPALLPEQSAADYSDAQPENTLPAASRPRSASEAVPLARHRSTAGQIESSSSKLYATKSHDSFSRLPVRRLSGSSGDDINHLSPNPIAQESVRRGRSHLAPPISPGARSIDTDQTADEFAGAASTDGARKELSVVIESDSEEEASSEEISIPPESQTLDPPSIPQPPTGTEEPSQIPASSTRKPPPPPIPTRVPPPPPPPPARKPPSPPNPGKVPKIPKRSPSYRVVNATQLDDSSSEEESLDSSSNRTIPVVSEQPPTSSFEEQQALQVSENDSPKTQQLRRPARSKTTHAQRVLMARSQYTPPTHIDPWYEGEENSPKKPPSHLSKLSMQSLQPRRHSSEISPSFSRHSISELPSQDMFGKSRERTADAVTTPQNPDRLQAHNRGLSESYSTLPMLTATRSTPANIPIEELLAGLDKETAPEPGLEVNELSKIPSRQRTTRSIEAGLYVVDSIDPTLAPIPQEEDSRPSTSAGVSQVNSIATSESSISRYPRVFNSETPGFMGLDQESVDHIVYYWNLQNWDQAESYLNGYLELMITQDNKDRIRRINHLLGVCASMKGQWTKAIPLFLSVLRSPITDISQIDDGDAAAAYWLGDTYALLNQRTEALLAYCIAERSSIFVDPVPSRLRDVILAEQAAVQIGASKADFRARWAKESFDSDFTELQSILDRNVVTAAAANSLFESDLPKTRLCSLFRLRQNYSRATSFYSLDRLPHHYRTKIVPTHFEPDTTWPMLFDPFFSMANVHRGRLLAYELDLIATFNSNWEPKTPKLASMGLTKMDCFTSTDLNWLIKTVRECLRTLGMEWSEVANADGTWFVVRYSFLQTSIATAHYFSISLFKQTLRPGYGVEICPEGICGARIIRTDVEHAFGVHQNESKHIKKWIREQLDEAAKSHGKGR